jgi:DMSO/TMAO reductase YedYZ molybdopterin-dependent catalytic subunit
MSNELDMAAYYQARADEQVWRAAKERGLSRRRFLELAGLVGGGALLGAACTSDSDKKASATSTTEKATKGTATESALVKDTPPSKFIYMEALGYNAEMKWENMASRGYLTPNDLFFVRQSTKTPRLTAENWKLTVSGAGVTKPLEFTYDQFLALPEVTSVIRYVECAGNGRAFFKDVIGQETFLSGEKGVKTPLPQWKLGAIGVAEWTGVPLGALLERAGVKPSAVDVVPGGLDQSKLRRPMSIAKAMEDDTLLAFAMNGDPLPADHGFPLRALTPGWVGNQNVKWVGSIEVSEEPVFVPQNTTLYVYIGPEYQPEPPRLGPVVETQVMKTAFELAWPGKLTPTAHTIRGRAWGPQGVAKVEYSVDDGRTWTEAKLLEPNQLKAWVRWWFNWEPTPGEYKIKARVIDPKGNVQPDAVPYNQQGMNYGAVVAHPVTVA